MAPTTQAAFEARAERHRRELHVHCYRMLGNFEEAEDAVQETLLRAWRAREDLERDEWLRAWLYKIATNTCLDAIKRAGRRVPALDSFRDVPWLQPYPDELLEQVAAPGAEPDAAVVQRETIELAFLAVIQLLPPRQRAVLILREVLGWPAREVGRRCSRSASRRSTARSSGRAPRCASSSRPGAARSGRRGRRRTRSASCWPASSTRMSAATSTARSR